MLDWNNFYGNTTDVVNVTKGPNALALNPEFTDAPNGDFSVGSNMEVSVEMPRGLSTSAFTLGAVSSAAGGGGGETSYVTIS